MGETVASPSVWRRITQSLQRHAKSMAMFAAGLFVALMALLIYSLVAPAPPHLTQREAVPHQRVMPELVR